LERVIRTTGLVDGAGAGSSALKAAWRRNSEQTRNTRRTIMGVVQAGGRLVIVHQGANRAYRTAMLAVHAKLHWL
jgi:hypothetical protein